MRKIFIIFILAISFISCSSESDSDSGKSGIYGKWDWVRTDGGFNFHIHVTPASTGDSVQLTLNENNTFSITKNGKIVTSGKYGVIERKSNLTGEMAKFITCTSTETLQEPINIVTTGIIPILDSNKLQIDNDFPDGIGSSYVRIE